MIVCLKKLMKNLALQIYAMNIIKVCQSALIIIDSMQNYIQLFELIKSYFIRIRGVG